jgi:hypothetical protein
MILATADEGRNLVTTGGELQLGWALGGAGSLDRVLTEMV